ncbi:MAG: PEP/pyruvate-binding domain-containing protein, partial [Dehalococcoidia bacterium]
MSADYVISLDDPAARDAAVAGEKAAALARLKQHGLPVPGGFVVHAEASAAATAEIAAQIESHLSAISMHDGSMRDLEAATGAVRELVEGLTVPPSLGDAVAAAYAEMGAGAVVAVRSSGTVEDLPGASFAGQYDSFLNVGSVDVLVDRLVAVWASLYSAHAVAYRQRAGLPLAGVRMAVLVQEQLYPDAAGVLFTRDPVSGGADRIVVNAALGLGEGVVAGEAPADTFALDARSLAVVDRTVVDKATMVAASTDGPGVEQRAVPSALRGEPALTDGQLTALGRLAQTVQQLEGGHRDIEFAVVDGDVRLLQSRPVTGVDDDQADVEWEIPQSEEQTWFLAGGDFGVPQPARRFEEDVRRVYSEHARTVFAETGVPMVRAHRITFVHGFPYSHAPSLDRNELQELLADRIRFRAEFEAGGRSYYLDEIEPEVLAHLERLGPFRRPAAESVADRFAFLEQALASYGRVQGDLHWRQLQGRPQGDEDSWPRQFSTLTGLPEIDSGTLLQAIENETTRMVRRLRGLARIVQRDPALAAAFAERDFERI